MKRAIFLIMCICLVGCADNTPQGQYRAAIANHGKDLHLFNTFPETLSDVVWIESFTILEDGTAIVLLSWSEKPNSPRIQGVERWTQEVLGKQIAKQGSRYTRGITFKPEQ